MDRHKDWAVIVCLVGGGQEINTGEAGIDAWLDAVNRRFPEWEMFISSRLTDSEYAAGRVLEIVRERPRTQFDDSLHLGGLDAIVSRGECFGIREGAARLR